MNWRHKSRSRSVTRRCGSAMAIALVVLLVVGLMAGLSLQSILRSHRQTREEEQRVQAELLADSALSRAVALLGDAPAWSGETWTISVDNPGNATANTAAAGVATIHVEKLAEAGRLQLSVTAHFPNDPVHRAQAERELTYIIPSPGENR